MKNNNQMTNFPTPSVGGLSVYLAQIKKFPMLDAEEEYMLAKNWRENGNLQSAQISNKPLKIGCKNCNGI